MLNKIIRVNMTALTAVEEMLPAEYGKLSGRALTSRLISDEVPPTADPFGPRNKLVFACGLLAGTSLSSAQRLSVGSKSPLTCGIKESNAGGVASFRMARLGVRAIIIEGLPSDSRRHALVLDKNGPRLQAAEDLSRLGVYEKAKKIYAAYGQRVGAILIGPAGERLQLAAGITNNDPDGSPTRYCGRGGLGAVMGAKGLLAVILDDSGATPEKPARADGFNEKVKQVAGWIREIPQTAEVFPKYGTAAMLNNTNAVGALPTRNFFTGTFEGAEKINGYAVHDIIAGRGGEGVTTHACMPGCLIKCSNIFPDRGGKALVSPLEYETIGLLGPNCCIDDLDVIARLNYLCNDYGVDTIEVGCALGVVMEAGVIPFGDTAGALEAVEGIGKGTLLGRIIASGVVSTGKVFGVRRVPAVKGQGMAAYDPRGMKGIGVTYATSPMGADHTAGNTARANVKHHLKDGQVEASKGAQLGATLMDYLGLCLMLGAGLKDRGILAGLIADRFGRETSLEELMAVAEETLSLEKEFNRKAGITEAHDRLPEYFYDEVNPATGALFDLGEEDLKA